MKKFKLKDMTRGWFIGCFKDAPFYTENCEVAYQIKPAGHHDKKHFHKIATEIALVTKGRFRINDKEFQRGDIIMIEPGEFTESWALTDSEIIVAKIPGAKDDKYLA